MWELLPRLLLPLLPERARAHGLLVYRPLHHGLIDRWLRRWRAQTAGLPLRADRGSFQALRLSLERGGTVGMLCDQRPSRPPWVPATFLQRRALFSHGIAALHTITGAPVWFAALFLVPGDAPDGFTLRLQLVRLATRRSPAVERAAPSDRELEVTASDQQHLVQAYADALSSAVRGAPSQYFWWHRRWRDEPDEFLPSSAETAE